MSLIYKMQFGISMTQIFKSQARSFDWKWKCFFLTSLSKSLKIIVYCICVYKSSISSPSSPLWADLSRSLFIIIASVYEP